MDPIAKGGGNKADNLLALCPNCHTLHTAGHIPQEAIRAWKRILVALNHSFDMRSRDLLLFLDQVEQEPPHQRMYSSDGVVAFAPLIATGLAEAVFMEANSGFAGLPPFERYRVSLTPTGRALLEAWKSGDDSRYRELLGPGKQAST